MFDSFILGATTVVYAVHHIWGWVGRKGVVAAEKFAQVMEKNKIAA